jgi:ribosomal protein L35
MTKKRKRQLRGATMVHETDVGRLERLLPHV